MKTLVMCVLLVACTTDPELPHDLDAALGASGFTLGRGSAFSFGIADCATVPDCFGANATGSYLLFSLPPAPGTVLPPTEVGDIPNTPAGQSVVWQLGSGEAVLVYGRTPPAARYFSVAPYVFDRALGDMRQTIFASVSDAINNATLGDAPFDTDAAFIVVSDAGVEARVRAALVAASWDDTQIHTIVMSPELVHFGTNGAADTESLLGRIALFDDPGAGARYLAHVPLTVVRLTSEAGDRPLPAPHRASRTSSTDEHGLEAAQTALGAAIETWLGTTPHDELAMTSYPIVTLALSPANCLDANHDCAGEVSDTVYSIGPHEVTSGGAMTLGDHDYFLIYGVNHEASGLARYSNVVVMNWAKRAGIRAFESVDMPGSADPWAPTLPDRDKLFVTKVARDCSYELHCLQIGNQFPGVPLDGNIAFMFRAYLSPDGTVSPDPAALLGEHVIHVRE